jgi:hypothetical protein
MDLRSTGCIALLPTGNKNGSVLFYSLATEKLLTRDHWTPLPTPEEVVQQMKLIHDKEIKRRSPTSTSDSSAPLPAHQIPLQPILNSLEHEYNAVRNIPDIPPDGPPPIKLHQWKKISTIYHLLFLHLLLFLIHHLLGPMKMMKAFSNQLAYLLHSQSPHDLNVIGNQTVATRSSSTSPSKKPSVRIMSSPTKAS